MREDRQRRLARALLAEPPLRSTKTRKAYPYGLMCPNCKGPIEDLFAEWTLEPNEVAGGKKATDCPYCEAPVLFQEETSPTYKKSLVVPPQDIEVLKRSQTKMAQWLPAGTDLLDYMKKMGMVRSDGRVAFENYRFLP